MGGFRRRLTLVVIALVAGTVILVSGVSFVLVRTSLRSQLVDDAVARSEFNVGVLASEELLPAGSDRTEFEDSRLAERFLLRGTNGVFVDFGDGDPYVSSPALLSLPDRMSDAYREIVDRGEYAYEFIDLDGVPSLVVGAVRPPDGPEFAFVFDASELAEASRLLGAFMAAVAAVVVLVGIVTARAIAGRVLRPVGMAAEAAARVAGGDLEARVPIESRDEFGSWAEAFNHMAGALEDKVAELEAARERERRFVADVSHELKTPLTGLVNEAQLLQPRLSTLDPSARRAGELLVADVGRLRRLVDDLLEISRIEGSTQASERTETDIERFVVAVAADRHPGARIVTDLRGPVMVDRLALERVIGNLLDNALVHAPGADVEVTVGSDPATSNLLIRVADRGPGVTDEVMAQMFDRFTMADEARTGGTGLGLAIARGHARRMGGEIVVKRNEPSGLVFEVRIPVTDSLHRGERVATSGRDDGIEGGR